jgi:hypothetical protein
MNKQRLGEALRRAVSIGEPARASAGQDSYLESVAPHLKYVDKLIVGTGATDGLERVLKEESELSLFSDAVQHFINYSMRVSFQSLALWLIQQSVHLGVEQAIDDLNRYLASEEFRVNIIAPLAGITVDRVLDIFDQKIFLVPFDQVPDSLMKYTFVPGGMTLRKTPNPTAALVVAAKSYKSHTEPDEEMPYECIAVDLENPTADLVYHRLLMEVCRVMTLLEGLAPVCLGYWVQPESWVPHGLTGFPGHWESLGDVLVSECASFKDRHRDRFEQLFRKYLNLPDGARTVLHLSIDRLSSARRSANLVDVAIDLAISLSRSYTTTRPAC